MADPILRGSLEALLEALEAVGTQHEELYDTDVREQMSDAIYRAFLKPEAGYVLPNTFGMFDLESNISVRHALVQYVDSVTHRAAEIGLVDPKARLDAFQDNDVKTRGGQYFDDFFGWASSI